MSRITIKDIAKLLSLNASTVSRALANHPNVNPETRGKVLAVAQEMGYTPNALAANLRRKHSGLIALILADMNMFFLPSVMRAVEEQVRQNGYQVIILQSNNDLAMEAQNLQICRQLSVEGILMSLSWNTHNLNHFASIFEEKIPIIFFDKSPAEAGHGIVGIDDRATARKAVRHLIEKGHRNIFGLFGNRSLSITRDRLLGHQDALHEAGLPDAEDHLVFAESSKEANEKLTPLLKEYGQGAALFAMSDELMVGAVQAAERLSLKIPRDLAVICISDGFAPEFYVPKITHLLHSGYEVGQKASRLLFEFIRQEQKSRVRLLLDCDLVEMESV